MPLDGHVRAGPLRRVDGEREVRALEREHLRLHDGGAARVGGAHADEHVAAEGGDADRRGLALEPLLVARAAMASLASLPSLHALSTEARGSRRLHGKQQKDEKFEGMKLRADDMDPGRRLREREALEKRRAELKKAKEERELRKVPFGNSGMLVTEVCVGTMTWGSFNAQEAEAHAQLDEAVLALGANFIDTAELYPVAFNYGKTTEKWIGTWLAARTAAKQLARSDVIIATKVNPNMIGGNPEGEKARPHGYEADIVERSCRQSIERMSSPTTYSRSESNSVPWPRISTGVMPSSSRSRASRDGRCLRDRNGGRIRIRHGTRCEP